MKSKVFSMKKQLILMFVATTIIVYLTLATILHFAIERHFFNQDYIHLAGKYNSIPNENLKTPRTLLSTMTHSESYQWLLKDGKVLEQNSSINLPADKIFISDQNFSDNNKTIEWLDDSLNMRAFIFPIDENYTLVMGISINHHKIFFSEFKVILFWSMGIMLIISTLYSFAIVKKGLKPIEKLSAHISKVTPNQLEHRVPLDDIPVELYELTKTHNKMLDRIENGFTRLSEFSSDIAHELRTPLSNISTQNQVILSSERSNEEYQETIESNLEELGRITKTINDVLYIAKAENSMIHCNDEWLDIDDEIKKLIEYFNILAEERSLSIEITGRARIYMDKNMFERTINNLLSNAIRHADIRTKINIEVLSFADRTLISVGNFGPTIQPSSIPHLFDRFYREDKSRQHTHTVGAGLGLSIIKSIAQAYSGKVYVESEQGYTVFTIEYPVYQ
tara:strand:+ start:39596 stop:40945 length:1350 start_codon:yes stop_codon:yes gene_type:complete